MYNIMTILSKLILAYILTCIIFGIFCGIYFVNQSRVILSKDELLIKYFKKIWFNCYVYICGITIMTIEFILSPYRLITEIIYSN